jgi:hypothetical protein
MDKDLLNLVRFDPDELRTAIKTCMTKAEQYEKEKLSILQLANAYRQLLVLHGYPESDGGSSKASHSPADSRTLADAAVSALQKAGGKLHGLKILEELQKQELCRDGKYPMGTLAVALRRDKRIEKDTRKRNTWKLVG